MKRTQFLCRLLGPFMLVLAVAELLHPAVIMEAGSQIVSSPSLLLLSGMMALLAGLAIVLVHNIWHGSAAAVVITALGWALILKGAALLLLTPRTWMAMLVMSSYPTLYPVYLAVTVLAGLFLTYAGFYRKT